MVHWLVHLKNPQSANRRPASLHGKAFPDHRELNDAMDPSRICRAQQGKKHAGIAGLCQRGFRADQPLRQLTDNTHRLTSAESSSHSAKRSFHTFFLDFLGVSPSGCKQGHFPACLDQFIKSSNFLVLTVSPRRSRWPGHLVSSYYVSSLAVVA